MEFLFKSTLKMIIFIVIPLCIISSSFAGLYIALNPDFDPSYKRMVIIFTISCAILIPFDSLMYIAAVFCNLKQCILIYIVSILSCPIIFSLALSRLNDATLLVVGYSLGRSVYPFIHLLIALIKYKKIPLDVKRLFFFPNDFGYNKENSIDIQVKSIIDCINISDTVRAFCNKHQLTNIQTNMLASCAEEMSNIYIMSGFTRDLKKIIVL